MNSHVHLVRNEDDDRTSVVSFEVIDLTVEDVFLPEVVPTDNLSSTCEEEEGLVGGGVLEEVTPSTIQTETQSGDGGSKPHINNPVSSMQGRSAKFVTGSQDGPSQRKLCARMNTSTYPPVAGDPPSEGEIAVVSGKVGIVEKVAPVRAHNDVDEDGMEVKVINRGRPWYGSQTVPVPYPRHCLDCHAMSGPTCGCKIKTFWDNLSQAGYEADGNNGNGTVKKTGHDIEKENYILNGCGRKMAMKIIRKKLQTCKKTMKTARNMEQHYEKVHLGLSQKNKPFIGRDLQKFIKYQTEKRVRTRSNSRSKTVTESNVITYFFVSDDGIMY